MTTQPKNTIIANPMYDVVFKTLMTDRDIARYFVGTILGVEIIDIDFAPQEYTYERKPKTEKQKPVKVIRLDFVATIRTKAGETKKVLIEIQQSQKKIDLFRFSSYLGKQYMQRDAKAKEEKDEDKVEALPIVAIYLVGYKMPANPHIAVKIDRVGINILEGEKVEVKDPLVDILTHDAYFIQVSRIQQAMYADWEKCSELMKLLSLFEQNYFVDGKFTKKYLYPLDPKTDKILKKMVNTLERIATDPYMRRVMEEQEWDELEVNLLQDALERQGNTIVVVSAERDNARAERDSALAELNELKRRFGLINT